ncbi:hypothetical protein A3K64_03870 [Candidatus Micrarchaeota archaeon RBG_16_36_9]|nr:MAG: hypothetical protein A3K64_03870 [Candidatus Micrarchaeota archaeon RBG_16_36_9]
MNWKQFLNIRRRYLIVIIFVVILLLLMQVNFKINKQQLTETVWVPHEYVDSSTSELVKGAIPQDNVLQEFNEIYISFDNPIEKVFNFFSPCSGYQNIKVGQILLYRIEAHDEPKDITTGGECSGTKKELLKSMGVSQYQYYYACYGAVSSKVATCTY